MMISTLTLLLLFLMRAWQTQGVEFGNVTTVFTDTGAMYQFQADLHKPGNVLYNAFRSLRSAPLSDLMNYELIAGDYWLAGSTDGIGGEARFSWIAHYVQLNASMVLISDSGINHCLRLLNRDTNRVTTFLGTCGTKGLRDGSEPLFDTPNGLLIDRENKDGVFLADMYNHALRYIDLESRSVITVTSLKNSLTYPEFLTYNITQPENGIQFFISNNFYITSVTRLASKGYESEILAGVKDAPGHQNGPRNLALFNNLKQMVMVNPHTLVVADAVNKDLRVVDVKTNDVKSLCFDPQASVTDTCSLNFPVGLAVINNSIYIADHLNIRKAPVIYANDTDFTYVESTTLAENSTMQNTVLFTNSTTSAITKTAETSTAAESEKDNTDTVNPPPQLAEYFTPKNPITHGLQTGMSKTAEDSYLPLYLALGIFGVILLIAVVVLITVLARMKYCCFRSRKTESEHSLGDFKVSEYDDCFYDDPIYRPMERPLPPTPSSA